MSKVKISEAASDLFKSGILSKETAEQLSEHDRETEVSVSPGFENPVFSLFLIDASGSMKPYRKIVIQSQHELIASLRQSSKCRKHGLYVSQTLFSHEVKVLNRSTRLDSNGKDTVPLLDEATYDPQRSDLTALYLTVFCALQDMAAIVSFSRKKNLPASFTIGLITDGKDNQKGMDPQLIQQAVVEFQNMHLLRKSVLIGLVSSAFTSADLDVIRARLGFQEAISLTQKPEEVRRAFALASQSAQSAY